MSESIEALTRGELEALFDLKYRSSEAPLGRDPARRLHYGYFNPDDHYEALVRRLVTPATSWLDIGCGRNLFPSNQRLARELADRCRLLVGVDPDATIDENPFVHVKVRGFVKDVDSSFRFSLVTMRMVAEHVADPPALLRDLTPLLLPGAIVVVYTINRRSPMPLLTAITPFAWHQPFKRLLWKTQAKDTFPTTYRMNTRRELSILFSSHGFEEAGFWYLDDCRTFQGFTLLNLIELNARRMLSKMNVRYPENCLLGIYRRIP